MRTSTWRSVLRSMLSATWLNMCSRARTRQDLPFKARTRLVCTEKVDTSVPHRDFGMSWGFDFMVNIHRSKFWLYTCRVNNPIMYEKGLDSQEMREKMEEAKSKLMGFFDYYATHPDAEKHLYVDFPSYFVWSNKDRRWGDRQKNTGRIGRLYACSPLQGERFYLRLLLTVVFGPSCYEDLCTVNGKLHPTFRSACHHRGPLDELAQQFRWSHT